jgi:PAP2 superfamily
MRSSLVAGWALAIVAVSGLSSAGAAASSDGDRESRGKAAPTVVVRWNETTLEAIRRARLGPPIVARALAIVHTCMYDAWAAYDRKAIGTRLGDALRRPPRERTPANRRDAVSVAAYRALADLFPAEQPFFEAQLRELGLDPDDTAADPSTPSGVASRACDAVLAFRHADGSNQLGDVNGGAPYSDYTGYQPVNTPDLVVDPNRWQPLRFSNGQTPGFVAPHWGLVAPFALPSGERLRPAAPSLYPDPRYTEQAEEILRLNATLTDRQKMIAEYWADGPSSELPPGHWNLFAQAVSRRDRHDLNDDVKMFLALNNALMDAAIAVWECKRLYDYVRPITAIRFLFAGRPIQAWGGPYRGTQTIDGGDWLPYQPGTFLTPPFAEYVSGHSTFSAAAAEVLARFTRSDFFGYGVVLPPGSSRIEPGLTPAEPVVLFWPTFSAAAAEAGWSRRYGGIHFRDGDLQGRQLGRRVGAVVWKKAMRLFERYP